MNKYPSRCSPPETEQLRQLGLGLRVPRTGIKRILGYSGIDVPARVALVRRVPPERRDPYGERVRRLLAAERDRGADRMRVPRPVIIVIPVEDDERVPQVVARVRPRCHVCAHAKAPGRAAADGDGDTLREGPARVFWSNRFGGCREGVDCPRRRHDERLIMSKKETLESLHS